MPDEFQPDRLEKLESIAEISQLPSRYAMAVDSRDIERVVSLFAPDATFGDWASGRDELRTFFDGVMQSFYRSIHQIVGHTFDFVSPDRATGSVYCRAEEEKGSRWIVRALCYSDEYVRLDGRWHFQRRTSQYWYTTDIREKPIDVTSESWERYKKHPASLPAGFPHWQAFWADKSERVGQLTDVP